MTSLLKKALNDLTPEDIQQLIVEGYPEGTHVEFKQELPSKNKNKNLSGDLWLSGSPSIGDYARNQILEEIVAFANSQGGYLILGIEESETKPPKAIDIKPLPRCTELAEKLRLQARDCISPMLPLFETKGVVLNKDGSGIVVCHVAQSRLAPHRLEPTSHCYMRRNDRSEKMTMREIQELTINRYQLHDITNKKFTERHLKFGQLMQSSFAGRPCHGLRVTLIPVSSNIWVNRVHNNKQFYPSQIAFSALLNNTSLRLESLYHFGASKQRPILRGTRHYYGDSDYRTHIEVYCDGTIEYIFLKQFEQSNPYYNRIHPEWIFSFLGNALLTMEQFRINSGFFDIEYGLEFAIASQGADLQVGQFLGGEKCSMEENPLIFPRISVGSQNEFTNIIQIINQDLWDSAGKNVYPQIEMDIPSLSS